MTTSTIPSIPLGGKASSIHITRVNLGLMGLTCTSESDYTPDEEAFKTLRASLAPPDSNILTLWDAGQFYGPTTNPQANLHLLKRYFSAYPQDKDRVILSVKGGQRIFGPGSYSEKGFAGLSPLTTLEEVRQSILQIKEALDDGQEGGGKQIDLWEPARFPTSISVEEAIKMYTTLRDEGLFNHLCLSEVSGETIKRAVRASDDGIAAVEVEYSPFCMEAEEQGVIKVCEEYQIPILAYSPVGKGLLTGSIRTRDDLPKGDPRLHQDRFSPTNFAHNITLADSLNQIASKRGVTATQICLAWILHRSPVFAPIPGTRKAKYAKENAEAALITLDEEEMKQIQDVLGKFEIKGGRYNEHARTSGSLWV